MPLSLRARGGGQRPDCLFVGAKRREGHHRERYRRCGRYGCRNQHNADDIGDSFEPQRRGLGSSPRRRVCTPGRCGSGTRASLARGAPAGKSKDGANASSKSASQKDRPDSTLVRSWLAISLVGGLLIFAAVSFWLDDTTLRSTLIGGVIPMPVRQWLSTLPPSPPIRHAATSWMPPSHQRSFPTWSATTWRQRNRPWRQLRSVFEVHPPNPCR